MITLVSSKDLIEEALPFEPEPVKPKRKRKPKGLTREQIKHREDALAAFGPVKGRGRAMLKGKVVQPKGKKSKGARHGG